jgi:hypothetical protein
MQQKNVKQALQQGAAAESFRGGLALLVHSTPPAKREELTPFKTEVTPFVKAEKENVENRKLELTCLPFLNNSTNRR